MKKDMDSSHLISPWRGAGGGPWGCGKRSHVRAWQGIRDLSVSQVAKNPVSKPRILGFFEF